MGLFGHLCNTAVSLRCGAKQVDRDRKERVVLASFPGLVCLCEKQMNQPLVLGSGSDLWETGFSKNSQIRVALCEQPPKLSNHQDTCQSV